MRTIARSDNVVGPRSKSASVVLGSLVVLYVGACSFGGWVALRTAWRAELHPRWDEYPRVVLSPVGRREHTVVDTRAGSLYARRICHAGRCEVLVRRGGGFAVLASVPADGYVEIAAGPEVRLLAASARAPSHLRREPPYPWANGMGMLWIVFVLGVTVLVLLVVRGSELKEQLRRIAVARRARVEEDGSLVFLDGGPSGPAVVVSPLAAGNATALRAIGHDRIDEGPFRGSVRERWSALAGTPEANLAQRARALGWVQAALALVLAASIAYVVAATMS